jgi:alpha-galactosidase
MERKMVLIGAGSASFTAGLVADLLAAGLEGEWTVGLVDISEEALDVAHGLVSRMVERKGAAVKIEASTDRRDILPGATVVVTTIAVGGRKGWELDVLVPREHGLFQPVGDTVGAGGISRALRQIPPMLDIAEDVARLCPGAYFFNYSNPMAAICRAVNKYTAAEVVGLCHGVQGTLRYLCGIIGVPYEEVSSLYLGMNHLTWITHLTRGGEDLWSRVDARLLDLDPGDNPFAWELYRAHGAFPAVLDRHITEFFPERFGGGEYYGKTLGLDECNILDVIHGGGERYAAMARQARGEEPLEDALFTRQLGEHEALVPIVKSLLGDEQAIFPMNVPNRTVGGVPAEFVLEMPVVAATAGCLPMALPEMPIAVLAWTVEALYGVELTVEAAVKGDRGLFIEALLYERAAKNLAAAEGLADDLLVAHREHLERFA